MKLRKIILLTLASITLSGCDFFGDEKLDTTLYELKITTNLDKAKDGLNAALGHERDQDEIDLLLESGATLEEIEKSGTCVNGVYYFYDGDGINLFEPFLPGYEFLGWFIDDKFEGYLDTDYDGNPDYLWNMPNKNTTIEARFKLMQFNIAYMDSDLGPAFCKDNPTTWNVEDGEVILKHSDRLEDGYKFEGWTFAMGGDTRYEGYVTKLNEQFLIDSNVAKEHTNGAPSLTFTLHENYTLVDRDVKLTFDNTVIDYVIVSVRPAGEASYTLEIDGNHFLSSGEVAASIQHGAVVSVMPTLKDPDNYEIDGIYYGSTKISTKSSTSSGITYDIIVSRDAEVELRWRAK